MFLSLKALRSRVVDSAQIFCRALSTLISVSHTIKLWSLMSSGTRSVSRRKTLIGGVVHRMSIKVPPSSVSRVVDLFCRTTLFSANSVFKYKSLCVVGPVLLYYVATMAEIGTIHYSRYTIFVVCASNSLCHATTTSMTSIASQTGPGAATTITLSSERQQSGI